MIKDLLNLIYPNLCPACDNEIMEQEGPVCLSCLHDMEQTNHHLDPRGNELFLRFAGLVPLSFACAMFFFDKNGKLQKIISDLKYHNRPQMGQFLGEYYGHALAGSEFFKEDSELVPVPLHSSRERERGYNQALEIAKGMAESTGLKVNSHALIRHQKTSTQTHKGKESRWENMRSVFSLKKPLTGNIILIDDVITTGSTLAACIKTLSGQENPPKSIGIIGIGVSRKE